MINLNHRKLHVPNLHTISKKYLFVLIPFFALLVLSININKPFVGHHDFMNAFEGMQARNYLTYGLKTLKFGAISSHVQGDVRSQQSYTLSYLPLLSVLISFSFSILGTVEWAERLVPALLSSFGVLAFFLICQKLWSKKIALMACLFYILNPMFIYFGKLPAPDIGVLSMELISFYFYIRWFYEEKKFDFILFNFALFIGGLFGWTIIYFGPLIVIHSAILKKFKIYNITPILIALSTLLLQLIHTFILTGAFLTASQISLIKFRFAPGDFSFGGVQFTLINYLKQEISWLQAYFTRVMLILTTIYAVSQFKKALNIQNMTLVFFLGLGLAHPIIFSHYVFVHDFLNIYLLPFMAISSALGLMVLVKYAQRYQVKKIIILILTLTILFAFLLERIKFTKALLLTNTNLPGKNMALILNKLQKGDNEAVIVSPRFDSFYGVFTNYYSRYSYTVTNESSIKNFKALNKYKYIIFIEQDIQDKNYYQMLLKKYKNDSIGDLTIIHLN